MSFKLLLPIAGAALLAGCNTIDPASGSPDPAFGEAVRWNKAVQVIDPDPVYVEGSTEPGSSGAKGAKAVERYRTDQVKQVETISSTESSSGSSGSGPR